MLAGAKTINWTLAVGRVNISDYYFFLYYDNNKTIIITRFLWEVTFVQFSACFSSMFNRTPAFLCNRLQGALQHLRSTLSCWRSIYLIMTCKSLISVFIKRNTFKCIFGSQIAGSWFSWWAPFYCLYLYYECVVCFHNRNNGRYLWKRIPQAIKSVSLLKHV